RPLIHLLYCISLFLTLRLPLRSTLFPYTTLFRSLNSGRASRGGYSLIPELFEFDKLSNPLRFLWHYSEDIKPSPVRSSWMLNTLDRKSTRLNSSHQIISYAVFCLKKTKIIIYINL